MIRMKLNFDNQWVMIVGASGGVGSAICHWLVAHSRAKLLLCDVSKEQLTRLYQSLKGRHEIAILTIDLLHPGSQQQLFAKASEGRAIYAMIYVAGLNYYGPTISQQFDHFHAITMINYIAPTHLTMLLTEHFIQQGGPGGILLFNSLAAHSYFPYQSIYSVSKVALDRFIRAYSYEMADSQIVFSQMYPGSINTAMTSNAEIFPYLSQSQRRLIAPVERVVDWAMHGFVRGKRYIYSNRPVEWFFRIISYFSESLVAQTTGRILRKLLRSCGKL